MCQQELIQINHIFEYGDQNKHPWLVAIPHTGSLLDLKMRHPEWLLELCHSQSHGAHATKPT